MHLNIISSTSLSPQCNSTLCDTKSVSIFRISYVCSTFFGQVILITLHRSIFSILQSLSFHSNIRTLSTEPYYKAPVTLFRFQYTNTIHGTLLPSSSHFLSIPIHKHYPRNPTTKPPPNELFLLVTNFETKFHLHRLQKKRVTRG